jgi:1-acyl-sn-glycerol-3-phosphate acyltransferase
MKPEPTHTSFWVLPHTVIIYLWIICATLVIGVLAIVVSFFSKTGNHVHKVAQWWGSSILWVSGITVRVRGMEHIDPNRSAIYMSNHQSNYDIPVFFGALPIQFRWLAKAELFKIPIFGQGMRGAGYISIDRSDTKSALISLKKAAQSIRNGTSVLIFPEGTRSGDATLLPFKAGGFVLALESGVPIVPMAVQGTFDIMAKGTKLIRRGQVTLTVRPAIDPTAYTRKNKEQLMDRVRVSIQEAMTSGPEGGGGA